MKITVKDKHFNTQNKMLQKILYVQMVFKRKVHGEIIS